MTRKVTRFGKSVDADQVFDAWSSRELQAMRRALAIETNAVDRHHLLATLVQELYRERGDGTIRQELHRVARVHLAELPSLLEELRRDHECQRAAMTASFAERARRHGRPTPDMSHLEPYRPPLVKTVELFARSLLEVGENAEAKGVLEQAAQLGLPVATPRRVRIAGRRRENQS